MTPHPCPLPRGEGVSISHRLSLADEIDKELDQALARSERLWHAVPGGAF